MPRPPRSPQPQVRRASRWPGVLLGLVLAASAHVAPGHPSVVGAAPLSDLGAALESAEPGILPAAVPTDLEAALVAGVNADRTANGLAPLSFDPKLLPIARQRAADQVPLPHLSHYDAAGQVVVSPLLAAARIDYLLAGENLARMPGPTATSAARAEAALMHSPDHRANILEPLFDRVAVGAATDRGGRVIFAQVFRATDRLSS